MEESIRIPFSYNFRTAAYKKKIKQRKSNRSTPHPWHRVDRNRLMSVDIVESWLGKQAFSFVFEFAKKDLKELCYI